MPYPTAPRLANPSDGEAGSDRTAALMADLCGAQNAAHAEVCPPLVSQVFDGAGLVDVHGAAFEMLAWDVPVVSSAHNSVRVRVHARGAGGAGGKFRARADGSGASDVANFGGLASVAEMTLPISTAGQTERIRLEVEVVAPGDAVELLGVSIATERLSAPLSPGTVSTPGGGSIVPVGQDSTGQGRPFSAALGRALINNAEAIAARDTWCWSWSGLSSPAGYGVGSGSMRDVDAPQVARLRPGATSLKIRARVRNQTASPTKAVIVVTRGVDDWPRGRVAVLEVDVPANTPTATVDHTLAIPKGRRAGLPGSSFQHALVGVVSSFSMVAVLRDETPRAEVVALAVWGDA